MNFSWKLQKPAVLLFEEETEKTVTEVLTEVEWLLEKAFSEVDRDQLRTALCYLKEATEVIISVEGEQDCKEIIKKRAEIAEMKAQLLNSTDQYFEAVKEAKIATELSPTWAVAFQTLGRAEFNFGDIEKARKSFLTALRLDPSLTEIEEQDLPYLEQVHRIIEETNKVKDKEEKETEENKNQK